MKIPLLPKSTQLEFYNTETRQTVVAKAERFNRRAALMALFGVFFVKSIVQECFQPTLIWIENGTIQFRRSGILGGSVSDEQLTISLRQIVQIKLEEEAFSNHSTIFVYWSPIDFQPLTRLLRRKRSRLLQAAGSMLPLATRRSEDDLKWIANWIQSNVDAMSPASS